jgi:hypothetical protein
MPSEVARCTDCNAPLKGVPSWLANAKVNFTCTNCPKRPSRAARYEPVIEARVVHSEDADAEIAEIEDLDEEAELDNSDEAEDLKSEE